MRMKLLAGLASLVFLALSSAAQAFITLDAIVPDSPMEGESVAVRVSAGLCDSIIEADGYPQITQSGNSIRMLLATTYTDDIILCNSEPGTVDLPFGEFSAGTYTLQLDRQYVDFFGATIVETVGTEGFAVSGFAGGTALPMLGPGGLLFLVLSMIAVVWLTLSRRHGCGVVVVLVVLLFPPGTEAQTAPESNRYVQVLLSSNSGAPPAEEVVSYYGSSPPVGPPPLQAFQVVEPVDAGYLLPLRATGDFLAYLEANPDIARARLERYLLVEYPPTTNMEAAVTSLSNDPNVLAAYLPQESDFSSVSVLEFGLTSPNSGLSYPIGPLGTPVQYGWDALNVAAAWELAGGYALIGTADTGLATSHAALRQFSSAGQYLGGNVNPGSLDLGDWPTSYDADVNEVTPMPLDPNSACNPKHLPAVEPARAGHGTHVAGLQAANSTSGLGVNGTCKSCGIAMWKIAQNQCIVQNQRVELRINPLALVPAITFMSDTGTQVINLSFGSSPSAVNYCTVNPSEPYCLALDHAKNRDVVVVASSGNHRTRLQFPARDERVVAAGGFDSNIALWDESPGSTTFCPNPANSIECGSNYTTVITEPRQELMAAAKNAFSTMYPGKDWVPSLDCGDAFGTPLGDGLGLCTGTSMSTPQVSGVVGILRSINPLVHVRVGRDSCKNGPKVS